MKKITTHTNKRDAEVTVFHCHSREEFNYILSQIQNLEMSASSDNLMIEAVCLREPQKAIIMEGLNEVKLEYYRRECAKTSRLQRRRKRYGDICDKFLMDKGPPPHGMEKMVNRGNIIYYKE